MLAIPAAVFVYILSQNDLFWDKLCLMGRLISCSTLFWIYLPTLGGKISEKSYPKLRAQPLYLTLLTSLSIPSLQKKLIRHYNVERVAIFDVVVLASVLFQ